MSLNIDAIESQVKRTKDVADVVAAALRRIKLLNEIPTIVGMGSVLNLHPHSAKTISEKVRLAKLRLRNSLKQSPITPEAMATLQKDLDELARRLKADLKAAKYVTPPDVDFVKMLAQPAEGPVRNVLKAQLETILNRAEQNMNMSQAIDDASK